MTREKLKDDPALWRAYWADRSVANRNRVTEHYLPLASNIAKGMLKTYGDYCDCEDLRQAACEGLITAVERYRPGGAKMFICFAYPRIAGAIHDFVRELDTVGRTCRRRDRDRYKTAYLEDFIKEDAAGRNVERIFTSSYSESPVDYALQRELEEVVNRGLNVKDKLAVDMLFLKGMKQVELAKKLGVTAGAITLMLATLRRKLMTSARLTEYLGV